MTEEEKEAITLLTELRGLYEANAEEHKFRGTLNIQVDEDDSDAIETLLNLVEKQQNRIANLEKQIKLMQSCDLAKVIKEQEKEIEIHKETENDYEHEIKRYEEEIEDLKEDNKSYKYIFDMQNKREYRSKFLKDFQKENGKNMLPDYDEIYKRYDKQKEEIKKLKQTIIINENVITSLEKDLFEGGRNYIVSKDKVREILFDIGTLHDGGYIKVKIIRERLEGLLEE